MKIVYLSNYYNHHQRCLAEALRARSSGFAFLETGRMSEERKRLGYRELEKPAEVRPYVPGADDNLIRDADFVIWGQAPYSLIRGRVRASKLVFRATERPFKTPPAPAKLLYYWYDYHKKLPKSAPIYLLCASAYAAYDYSRLGLFRDKAYQWGYFPGLKPCTPEALIARKDSRELLWCGRFLDWKHPDDALRLAKRLRDMGKRFHLTLIGTGALEPQLKAMVRDWGLEELVRLTGSMPPEQVREHMERAGIYLFTSDRQEGWGAVLNESMNACCAVVASHSIGSVPYLLKNGENGLVYRSGDGEGLYRRVAELLDRPEEQRRLGAAAYETIRSLWNADHAANALCDLAARLLSGREGEDAPFGPCARALPIRDDWFREEI